VSGQLHAPAALLPDKEPRDPLDRRLYGPQGRSGPYGAVTIVPHIQVATVPAKESCLSVCQYDVPLESDVLLATDHRTGVTLTAAGSYTFLQLTLGQTRPQSMAADAGNAVRTAVTCD
jgi:hypothetical protein